MNLCKPFIINARPAGIEPATFGFVVQHSIQLSYGRIMVSKSTVFYYHIPNPLVNETQHAHAMRSKTCYEFPYDP